MHIFWHRKTCKCELWQKSSKYDWVICVFFFLSWNYFLVGCELAVVVKFWSFFTSEWGVRFHTWSQCRLYLRSRRVVVGSELPTGGLATKAKYFVATVAVHCWEGGVTSQSGVVTSTSTSMGSDKSGGWHSRGRGGNILTGKGGQRQLSSRQAWTAVCSCSNTTFAPFSKAVKWSKFETRNRSAVVKVLRCSKKSQKQRKGQNKAFWRPLPHNIWESEIKSANKRDAIYLCHGFGRRGGLISFPVNCLHVFNKKCLKRKAWENIAS